MKKYVRFLPLIFISMGLMLSGCSIMQNLKEITDSANSIVSQANDLTKLVDGKVESGELSREAGAFLDDRISKLLDQVEGTIDQSGGHLFDSANGTINLTFANISQLLDQIKTGILDDSVPAILDNISSQLTLQVDNLSSQVQDLVVLTFGNTFILLDKATNSAVIIGSIVLLAIGLIIFAIILLLRKDKMNTGTIVGLSLVGIYVVFFMLMIFVTPVRGYIIAGFDFGKKYEGTQMLPQIVGVIPEQFVIGKNARIIIYGNYLNKLNNYKVGLYQGDQMTFQFPAQNVVEATKSRIILGNFDKNLGWVLPSYETFKSSVIGTNANPGVAEEYANLGNQLEKRMMPVRNITYSLKTVHAAPRIMASTRIKAADIKEVYKSSFSLIDPVAAMNAVRGFFASQFKLQDGDYGLRVYQGTNRIEAPQYLSVQNPPPPPPKPDIWVQSVVWNNGFAVKGRDTTIRVRLGFSHPESIKNNFSVRVTVTPPDTQPFNINVLPGDISSAQQNNYVDLVSSSFRIANSGNYTFTVAADPNNTIDEANEGNNTLSQSLYVGKYSYTARVYFQNFMSTYGCDRYEMHFAVSVPNNPSWLFDVKPGSGNANIYYNINQYRDYSYLQPGDNIIVSVSGIGVTTHWWKSDDYDSIGTSPPTTYLILDQAEQIPMIQSGDKFKATGYIKITQIYQ